MKGFKPTGYGPTAGFKFPASFGFTGSTGAYTNVQPYVRRMPRAFKDGGYVSESVPDPGHATVQRARPYTEEDRESGGKTPLRPGYKRGGKMKARMKAKTPGKMRKADGGSINARKNLDDWSARADSEMNENARNQAEAQAQRAFMRSKRSDESWRHKSHGASGPLSQAIAMKGKFAAADGGRVYGSSAKPFLQSIGDLPALAREGVDYIRRSMSAGRRIAGTRGQSVMEKTDAAQSGDKTMASNYSRGGKMKRMGYSRGGKMRRMGYAEGGGVSVGEAKKIAQATIGEHVRYPAPKGHKGLGKMCK